MESNTKKVTTFYAPAPLVDRVEDISNNMGFGWKPAMRQYMIESIRAGELTLKKEVRAEAKRDDESSVLVGISTTDCEIEEFKKVCEKEDTTMKQAFTRFLYAVICLDGYPLTLRSKEEDIKEISSTYEYAYVQF